MKFKTNLKCDGCIKRATPYLDRVPNMKEWSVDLSLNNSILEVEGDVQDKDVIEALERVGYHAERV